MKTGQAVEGVLSKEMATIGKFPQTWKVQPISTKRCRQSSISTTRNLKVNWCSQRQHTKPAILFKSKYLCITLVRTLTYRRHLESLRKELTSRVALMRRLDGFGWGTGAGPTTLRTATSALLHSTAEYCYPVWGRSAHIRLYWSCLSSTMPCELWLDACVLYQRTILLSSRASNMQGFVAKELHCLYHAVPWSLRTYAQLSPEPLTGWERTACPIETHICTRRTTAHIGSSDHDNNKCGGLGGSQM